MTPSPPLLLEEILLDHQVTIERLLDGGKRLDDQLRRMNEKGSEMLRNQSYSEMMAEASQGLDLSAAPGHEQFVAKLARSRPSSGYKDVAHPSGAVVRLFHDGRQCVQDSRGHIRYHPTLEEAAAAAHNDDVNRTTARAYPADGYGGPGTLLSADEGGESYLNLSSEQDLADYANNASVQAQADAIERRLYPERYNKDGARKNPLKRPARSSGRNLTWSDAELNAR